MKEENAQSEYEEEATQDWGMTNPKYSATIAKSLAIMLLNVKTPNNKVEENNIYMETKPRKWNTATSMWGQLWRPRQYLVS